MKLGPRIDEEESNSSVVGWLRKPRRRLAARFALKTAMPVYNEPVFAYLA
jgi:hypothetical protein